MSSKGCQKKTCSQNNDSKNRKNVLYIPGFLSGQNPQKKAKEELRRQFPGCKVRSLAWDKSSWLDIFTGIQISPTLYSSVQSAWDSFAISAKVLFEAPFFLNRPSCILNLPGRPSAYTLNLWRNTVQKAKLFAKELAKLIEKMPKSECENLVLVGHSLGAYIVIHTMKQLSSRQKRINQAFLLGAAVDSNDSAIPAACRAAINPIEYTVNRTDWALLLYTVLSFNTALGQRGYSGKKPLRLKEIVLSMLSHSSANYIKRLGRTPKRSPKPKSSFPIPIPWPPLPFPLPRLPFPFN